MKKTHEQQDKPDSQVKKVKGKDCCDESATPTPLPVSTGDKALDALFNAFLKKRKQ